MKTTNKIVSLLAALHLIVGFFAAEFSLAQNDKIPPEVSAKAKVCASKLGRRARITKKKNDFAKAQGVVSRSEHFADVILTQGGLPERAHYEAFREITLSLVAAIKKGELATLNEKIDGSPAINFGFTKEGKPFIAYKDALKKKGRAKKKLDQEPKPQAIITSEEDALRLFPKAKASAKRYGKLIKTLGDRMAQLPEHFRNLIFQGDVIFSESRGRKLEDSDERVTFRPNIVKYTVTNDHPIFPAVRAANMGFVVHTVRQRTLDDQGYIGAGEIANPQDIRAFVEAVNGKEIFATHCWHDEPRCVGNGVTLVDHEEAQILELLEKMKRNLDSLSTEFVSVWGTRVGERFRAFFGAGLKRFYNGGIYLAASRDAQFYFDFVMERFWEWFSYLKQDSEGTQQLKKDVQWLLENRRDELSAMVEAYYDANRIHFLLLKKLKHALRSKLGGGEIEGMMVSSGSFFMKFIDRLGFTRRNFFRDTSDRLSEEQVATGFSLFREPFNQWRPGTAFIVMKAQPIHAGHLLMIRKVIEKKGLENVIVIASDKAPNLEAEDWKGLGVNDTLRDLRARVYKHVFSADLRREILTKGLPAGTNIRIMGTHDFWMYAGFASQLSENEKISGKVSFVVGQKEIDERRYSHEFARAQRVVEPLVSEMQAEGVGATQVRAAIKTLALEPSDSDESRAAHAFLRGVYAQVFESAYVEELILKLVAEWKTVDTAVQGIVAEE